MNKLAFWDTLQVSGHIVSSMDKTGARHEVTMDPAAIATAIDTLHETLARCQEERQALAMLVDRAHDMHATEEQGAADVDETDAGANAAEMLARWSQLDAWVGRRLMELHEADESLARRELKLQKLHAGLTKLSGQLDGRIQALNAAHAQAVTQTRTMDQRISHALHQLEMQQTAMAVRLAEADAADRRLGEKLEDSGSPGSELAGELERQFEQLTMRMVRRFEQVEQASEKWLGEKLAMCQEAFERQAAERRACVEKTFGLEMEQLERTLAMQVEKFNAAMSEQEESARTRMEELQQRQQRIDAIRADAVEPLHAAANMQQKMEQALSDVSGEMKLRMQELEREMEGGLAAVNESLRTKMATAQGDVRSMLQMIESQAMRRLEKVKATLGNHEPA